MSHVEASSSCRIATFVRATRCVTVLAPLSLMLACARPLPDDRLPPATAPTQEPIAPAPDTAPVDEPIPASLLRRLAETADAERTGRPVWIVVHLEFPHDVVGVYERSDAAMAAARRPGLGAFGPYVTPRDFELPADMFMSCVHDRYSSIYRPMPVYCPESPIPLDSIRGLTLVIETATRGTIRIPMPPDSVDAVFFSVTAFDKFLAPYYTRLYGLARAARLRVQLVEEVLRRRR